MDNFEIQAQTNDNLGPTVGKLASTSHKAQEDQAILQTTDQINCIMCIFSSVFKLLYILMYCILRFVADSYLGLFVSITILISIDFWITKNLTGRKLVGLRWWSQLNEEGQELWIFQSRNPKKKPHLFNALFFWIPQLITITFWVIIMIINFVTLDFFLFSLALFCQSLTIINFGCYFKCRGQHQRKAQLFTNKFGIKARSQIF